MGAAEIEQQLDVVVIQRVKNGFPRATALDQSHLAQLFQVVGHRRLGHVQLFRRFGCIAAAVAHGFENFDMSYGNRRSPHPVISICL